MDHDYAAWMRQHVQGDVTGRCVKWTHRMAEVFPALSLVRGHVLPIGEPPPTGSPQGYVHWWLVTHDGTIVDPTAAQYPWALQYIPWTEGQDEPTGRCAQCGGDAYGWRVCCTPACSLAYAAAISRGR